MSKTDNISADRCGFREAWIGHCSNEKPCEKHQNQKCWHCGSKATGNCPQTSGPVVCGMPACDEHPHSPRHRRSF